MRGVLIAAGFGAVALVTIVAHGASAQGATGTITGRVLWGSCIRAIPLPAAPDVQAQPAQPAAPRTSGLPAGAVLVAVQNTAVSARTDEAGSFTLSGVPAGQYLTVAAGPVANAASAIAERPNVFVDGDQSMDIGTLMLGGSPGPLGIACRALPPVVSSPGAESVAPTPDSTDSNP
jgi:hypothetical protein